MFAIDTSFGKRSLIIKVKTKAIMKIMFAIMKIRNIANMIFIIALVFTFNIAIAFAYIIPEEYRSRYANLTSF